jgi:hypothetical protein
MLKAMKNPKGRYSHRSNEARMREFSSFLSEFPLFLQKLISPANYDYFCEFFSQDSEAAPSLRTR